MYIITNKNDQFFNPRTGAFDNIFDPAKHAFYERRKLLFQLYSKGWINHPDIHVEQVELHPTYTPVTITEDEIQSAKEKYNW